MGRKKIEIKLITHKKERAVTFCKRKIGLLKKAAELSILCGIKISVIFTDMNQNIHVFSNNKEIHFIASSKFAQESADSSIFNYNRSDYPFDKIKETNKRVKKKCGDLLERTRSLLKKREFEDILSKSEREMEEVLRKKKSTILEIPKIENKPQTKILNQNYSMELTEDQANKLMKFDSQINDLILRGKNGDEDLIVLLTLKQLVTKYFSRGNIADDEVIATMRKITPDDFLLMLSSIKFKDKNKDMILAYVTIINDILLELILNPKSLKRGSFHFGSLIARGGKAIIGIFIFLIKNLFQQLGLLRSQFSPERVSMLTTAFVPNYGAKHTVKRIKVIKTVIENCLLALSLDSSTSQSQNNPDSGFQLHSSSKSDEKIKLINTLSDTENIYKMIGTQIENPRSPMRNEMNGHGDSISRGVIESPPRTGLAVPRPFVAWDFHKKFGNSLFSQGSLEMINQGSLKLADPPSRGNLDNFVSGLLGKK